MYEDKKNKFSIRIGVDCGGTKCEAIAIHKNKIIAHVYIPKPATKETIFEIISQVKDKIPISQRKMITFIGIGFPAPILDGKITQVNNISGWRNINLENLIRKKFGYYCKAENDAKCFALGESIHPKNKNFKTIVGITLGTGIGCGIIHEGKIFRGRNGAAGEINMIPFPEKKLEKYTSKQFFIEKYGLNPVEIFHKASQGLKKYKKAVDEFAIYLGKMLSIVVLCYDPDCIIFGGNISNSFHLFERKMKQELKKHIFKTQFENLVIKKSETKYASCIGASMLK